MASFLRVYDFDFVSLARIFFQRSLVRYGTNDPSHYFSRAVIFEFLSLARLSLPA